MNNCDFRKMPHSSDKQLPLATLTQLSTAGTSESKLSFTSLNVNCTFSSIPQASSLSSFFDGPPDVKMCEECLVWVSHCHTVTLSYFHAVILSHSHTLHKPDDTKALYFATYFTIHCALETHWMCLDALHVVESCLSDTLSHRGFSLLSPSLENIGKLVIITIINIIKIIIVNRVPCLVKMSDTSFFPPRAFIPLHTDP